MNTLLTVGAVGVFGYFMIYHVLPGIKIPTGLPSAQGAGPSTLSGGTGEGGIRLIYPTTGRSLSINVGSNHRNGQRYNVNHNYENYIGVAYLKTVSGQEAIGCKNAGPNHGSCSSGDKCFWIDPDLQLSNGSIKLGYEYPHPTAHDISCSSCKSLGVDLHNKWVGCMWAHYGTVGNRWIELWVDPSGVPGANKWVRLMKENYTAQLPANLKNRQLPTSGRGLEFEIRMRGGHGTDMKLGRVYEIRPPTMSMFTNIGTVIPRRLNNVNNIINDYNLQMPMIVNAPRRRLNRIY